MTERTDEKLLMSVSEQAAEWFIRWHNGEVTLAERYAYLQWLKTSPVHIGELLRVCRMYSWIGAMKLPLCYTDENTFTNVVELRSHQVHDSGGARSERRRYTHHGGTAADYAFEVELARAARSYQVDSDTLVRNARAALTVQPLWRWSQRWREFTSTGVVAGLARAAAVATAVLLVWFVYPILFVEEIETGAGQWRELALADGTVVALAPHSQLRSEYDDDSRYVLLEKGEALFSVAKEARPFVVRTRLASARSISTEFAVSVSGDDDIVIVTVKEGLVAVSPTQAIPVRAHAAAVVPVAAGHQLTIANTWPVAPVRIDVARELAWADKRLVFEDGDTLATATNKFNRLNRLQIDLDVALAGRPVRGVFDAADPLTFAQVVARELDLALRGTANRLRLEVNEQMSGDSDAEALDEGWHDSTHSARRTLLGLPESGG